jgi:hypothetical protein
VRIALVPLDERPVNTTLVSDIAAIAGATVLMPPAAALPRFREPGDCDAIAEWLRETSAVADAAVVSLDMLGYGGLIASRTTHDSARAVLDRIAVLERIHAERPELPIGALNVFLRASNSDNASEEPRYWSEYGRLLHRLGGSVHASWLEGSSRTSTPASVSEPLVPDAVRQDFARRRLRNHIVNLAGLDLAYAGHVSTLLLTADDTAPRSAGSAEQQLVDYWTTLSGPRDTVLIYPGADEVAAVMTARLLAHRHEISPSFTVTCVEEGGLDRVAPYENTPLATGVGRQVAAAGGRLEGSGADVRLVVHAPAPTGGDFYGTPPERTDPALLARTVREIATALDAGERVALADCRYPNGSDPALVEALRDAGLLLLLDAYGGWNTAGNTLGSTVAAAAVATIGRRTRTLDPAARERFLLHRLVEDYGYQARVRNDLLSELGEPAFEPPRGDDTAELTRHRLDDVLRDLTGSAGAWLVGAATFPWDRAFEVDLRIEHAEPAAGEAIGLRAAQRAT